MVSVCQLDTFVRPQTKPQTNTHTRGFPNFTLEKLKNTSKEFNKRDNGFLISSISCLDIIVAAG